MEYNIDILIAGCNTNCRHCYVDGGPAPAMPLADVELCFDRLVPVFQHFSKAMSFTLDNEAYLHPELPTILRRVFRDCPEHYSHHGSTTGIAFNHRSDKESLWKLQLELGLDYAGITLHGHRENHNFLTRNPRSFDEILEYARFLRAHGGKAGVNLMLSKLLIADRDALSRTLEELAPEAVYLTIPNAAPNRRLWEYQQWRAGLSDCEKLVGYLRPWGLDEDALMEKFQNSTHRALLNRLLSEGIPDQPQQCFLSLHRDLTLWHGNTGVEQRLLGSLRELTSQEIIEQIERCQANWDFYPRAFSDAPSLEAILEHAKQHPEQELLYPDPDSLLSRMAQELLHT